MEYSNDHVGVNRLSLLAIMVSISLSRDVHISLLLKWWFEYHISSSTVLWTRPCADHILQSWTRILFQCLFARGLCLLKSFRSLYGQSLVVCSCIACSTTAIVCFSMTSRITWITLCTTRDLFVLLLMWNIQHRARAYMSICYEGGDSPEEREATCMIQTMSEYFTTQSRARSLHESRQCICRSTAQSTE